MPLAKGTNVDDLNLRYTFDDSAGAGVDVYVLDTGVRTTHQEFQDRAELVYAVDGLPMTDDHGHGTHVSGTVAGKTFGVG